ncbi:hypothetical protein [Spiroplasma sp. SV19]|uniref:hypothetical protein n=1 Tax=Spiroplasma sp. SV19 TaxID=2570468 RepID=UPI0024B679D6|nr:hypothetical protein [Spiroplasma sp. SV19]WHQ36401.1 hypothetical protein E7Y35_00365 [Spiroplasma sp. SV19]WHQ37076.1 hypothetical protein E7Y35_04160 [Spiroplasma sp. SV19]
MPNWAMGEFNIKGLKQDLVQFLKNWLSNDIKIEEIENGIKISPNGRLLNIAAEEKLGHITDPTFNSARAFLYSNEIFADFLEDTTKMITIEVCGEAAWSWTGQMDSTFIQNAQNLAEKYNIDFKCYSKEPNMGFTETFGYSKETGAFNYSEDYELEDEELEL